MMACISFERLPVVTSSQMAQLEKKACEQGASSLGFMEEAGQQIAHHIHQFIESHHLDSVVTLLIGKGNNGGDACMAGWALLKQGVSVRALALSTFEECSSLCQQMQSRFLEVGGRIDRFQPDAFLSLEGVLVDGLMGTGFQGQAEGLLAAMIHQANRSNLPILSIDIPSGLDGNTGEVGSVAIRATQTLCLGVPKIGFFLGQGWDHVGELLVVDFGLSPQDKAGIEPMAYLLEGEQILSHLPSMKRSRHKYEAGYVISVAGSSGMPGAALLSGYAALRAGAGLVRLFHPPGMQTELSSAPYELIREAWDGVDLRPLEEEFRRAQVVLIGPGMGRSKSAEKRVKRLLSRMVLPCVIDADALFFLAEHPSWKIPKGAVLTPHRGEMTRLLARFKKKGSFEECCQSYADTHQVTVVLKGAVTWIFHPQVPPLINTVGDPGMATAGSGDVLTGIIAALIAQGLPPRTAAAVGVYLHGLSGTLAAEELTSYCLMASDLIDYLPEAFLCGKGMA